MRGIEAAVGDEPSALLGKLVEGDAVVDGHEPAHGAAEAAKVRCRAEATAKSSPTPS